MDDKIAVLINSIRRDMDTIAAIYGELERHPLGTSSDNDTLIIVAYHLHNLYNAFENIFQSIAAVFENSVDDVERWHARLLERMQMDVMPLRPAVIDENACDALDELRRFRHLFRHMYRVKLDPLRLQLVMHKALVLKAIYADQIGKFVEFLKRLNRDRK